MTAHGPSGEPDAFVIEEEVRDDLTVLRVRGELDLLTAPRLEERLAALAGDGRAVLVDLDAVSFMDSSGITVILRAANEADADGRLHLTEGSEPVRKVLAVAGLLERLPFADDGRPG